MVNKPVTVAPEIANREHPYCPSCRQDMTGVTVGGGEVPGAPHLSILTFRTACCGTALSSQMIATALIVRTPEVEMAATRLVEQAKADAHRTGPAHPASPATFAIKKASS